MIGVKIRDQVYCLSSFANEFGFSYSKVRRYYQKGFRNEELLEALEEGNSEIVINDQRFKNRFQAAKELHIPPATFYRKYNSGKIDKLI